MRKVWEIEEALVVGWMVVEISLSIMVEDGGELDVLEFQEQIVNGWLS